MESKQKKSIAEKFYKTKYLQAIKGHIITELGVSISETELLDAILNSKIMRMPDTYTYRGFVKFVQENKESTLAAIEEIRKEIQTTQ